MTGPIEILFLALLLAAVTLAGGRRAPPPRVLLLGDSLAQGLTRPFLEDAEARGANGWRARATQGQTLPALPSLDGGPWALVLATWGTNDAAGKLSPDAFGMRAAALRSRVEAQGGALVWLAPPPMPFAVGPYLDAATRAGVVVLAPPPGLPRAPDGVHLPPAGYRAWWADVGPRALLLSPPKASP